MICRKHPIRSLLTSKLRKENIRYPQQVSDITDFFCKLSINNSELQISCVFAFFMLWKQVKTNVLSDQSVHIMHTYCCVNKLSKLKPAELVIQIHNKTDCLFIIDKPIEGVMISVLASISIVHGSGFWYNRFLLWTFDQQLGAPDKLRICVFYAMKTSKNECIIRSECTHYAYILQNWLSIYYRQTYRRCND
jgi:hypothetical protein